MPSHHMHEDKEANKGSCSHHVHLQQKGSEPQGHQTRNQKLHQKMHLQPTHIQLMHLRLMQPMELQPTHLDRIWMISC